MSGQRILIIEDEGLVALALKQCLTGLGYIIPATAATGEEAIRMIGDEKPDLVLMDIRLKGKTDGIDLAYWIRQTYNIPVVFLTAHSDEKTLERAKVAEPFGYILKPFEENGLHSTIEMALHKASIESQLQRTKNKLSAILRSIQEGIILCDTKGKIDYFNQSAARLTGYTLKDARNTNILEMVNLFEPDTHNNIDVPLDEVVTKGRTISMDQVLIQSDDREELPASFTVTPIVGEDANVAGIVFSIRELSTNNMPATSRQM